MRPLTRDRYLTDAELQRFMRAVRERRHPNQARDYALFSILANTGIRPEEARALRRRDIVTNGRPPRIYLPRVKRGNGPRPTTILPMHKEVAAVVARYLERIDPAPESMLFPFTKRQSRRLFHYYARRAGLSPLLRLYALRHTVGMRLWRHTGDLRVMHALMGHVRLKAARAYVHAGKEQLRAAQAAVQEF